MTRRGWVRSLGTYLAGSLAAAIALVTGLELYYRAQADPANPHPIRGLYELDQYSGFALQRNLRRKEFEVHGIAVTGVPSVKKFYVSTTADGIRSEREIPVSRRADTLRIMVIGSSFDFGYGVNDADTWPALLERRFATERASPIEVEVINGSMPGTHNLSFLVRYLSRLEQYRPDAVIIVTGPEVPYGGPDLSAYTLAPRDDGFARNSSYYIDEQGILRSHLSMNPIWRALSGHSALARTVLIRMQTTQSNAQVMTAYAQSASAVDDTSLTPLVAFRDRLRQKDVPLFVVIRETLLNVMQTPTPEEIMKVKLARRDIPALNLRPLYEPFENSRKYLVDDGHWNEAGHQVAADAIFTFLVAHNDALVGAARQHLSAAAGR